MRVKEILGLAVAGGLAIGGAIQTVEVVRQRVEIDGLRQTITDQRLDIMDLQNNECWDFNLIQALGLRALGIPPMGLVDCDKEKPMGHPPTPTPVPGIKG